MKKCKQESICVSKLQRLRQRKVRTDRIVRFVVCSRPQSNRPHRRANSPQLHSLGGPLINCKDGHRGYLPIVCSAQQERLVERTVTNHRPAHAPVREHAYGAMNAPHVFLVPGNVSYPPCTAHLARNENRRAVWVGSDCGRAVACNTQRHGDDDPRLIEHVVGKLSCVLDVVQMSKVAAET